MAGFVRGILLALFFMVMIAVLGTFWRGMAPRERGDSFATWEGWRARLLGTFQLLPVAPLVVFVLGVIYLGIVTPSEAAALAIVLNSDEIVTPLLGSIFRCSGLIGLFTRSTQETLRASRPPSRTVARRNLHIVQDSFISTVRTTGMIFLISQPTSSSPIRRICYCLQCM